jgi:citrate lyase subunit beta/citryl-CoA lyase
MRPDARTARSWLFVPGDSERKLARCWSAGADAVILDLEDAVSADRKIVARGIACDAVAGAGAARRARLVVIRVNARVTRLTDDDIAAVMECGPDALMLPKVETADDIRATAAAIDRAEAAAGIAAGSTALIPIVTESAAPVFRLPELCAAHPRNAAILWGSEDLSAAIGARRVKDDDGRMLDVFRTVRALALLAGAAAGLGVIDTPVMDFGDEAQLSREAREACWMGFTGKLAIHPAQVAPINAAFTPDAAALAEARAIVAGAADHGGAAFRLGNRMIDMPHVKAAERIVHLDRILQARAGTAA